MFLSQIFHLVIFEHWLWVAVTLFILYFALHHANYCFAVLAFMAGMIIGNLRCFDTLSSEDYLTSLIGNELTISGIVADDPTLSENKTTLRLHKLEIHHPDRAETTNLSSTVTVHVQLAGSTLKLERSDEVTVSGTLSAGFGTYPVSLYRPKVNSIRRSETGDLPARIKHQFATIIKNLIPSPASELGLGYLVGMKSGLPEDLSDTLQIVGMTHVVVASGAHLGILVGAAQKLFGRLSKFAGLLSSLILILAFVLVIGATPSMTRAALVSVLSLSMAFFGRRWTPLRLLSFVGALTLLINPTYVLNFGWQLSFASFFGLLIISPRLQHFLYGAKQPPWLAAMLITSLSTSLICSPILIYSFGSISLLSFIANLFILPTLPYAMLLVFLTGITSFIPWLAGSISYLATMLLNLHIALVNFLSEKRMLVWEFPTNQLSVFLLYLPILLSLLLPSFPKLLQIAKNKKLWYNDKYEGV